MSAWLSAAVKYDLWMEGWRWPVRQAEDASAKFLGNYEAETFADACQRWCDEKLEQDQNTPSDLTATKLDHRSGRDAFLPAKRTLVGLLDRMISTAVMPGYAGEVTAHHTAKGRN